MVDIGRWVCRRRRVEEGRVILHGDDRGWKLLDGREWVFIGAVVCRDSGPEWLSRVPAVNCSPSIPSRPGYTMHPERINNLPLYGISTRSALDTDHGNIQSRTRTTATNSPRNRACPVLQTHWVCRSWHSRRTEHVRSGLCSVRKRPGVSAVYVRTGRDRARKGWTGSRTEDDGIFQPDQGPTDRVQTE